MRIRHLTLSFSAATLFFGASVFAQAKGEATCCQNPPAECSQMMEENTEFSVPAQHKEAVSGNTSQGARVNATERFSRL